MDIGKLEEALASLVKKVSHEEFIYELLLAYDQPKASISRLRGGDYNLATTKGYLLWTKKVHFRHEAIRDLHVAIEAMRSDSKSGKQHPRFVIVTDYKTFLAADTRTNDTL